MIAQSIGKCLRNCGAASGVSLLVLSGTFDLCANAADISDQGAEDYVREEMPPGFNVTINELEGPVFIDAVELCR